MKKRLLWIGDAACDSGFSRATHNIVERLLPEYECAVLGVNYRGYPHEYPYHIYPARNLALRNGGGDYLGFLSVREVMGLEQPDVVVVQNDPWHMRAYAEKIHDVAPSIPTVAAVAIDGKNCMFGKDLNEFTHNVFWTRFGQVEAQDGGMSAPSTIIPLGVDRHIYHPGDRIESRRRLQLPTHLEDAFIFLNVNRNQPRKRLDLTIKYFARFLAETHADNAYLYLHVSPTGDVGVDVEQLAKYYGILNRVILAEPRVHKGVSEALLATTYRAANAVVSTTTGEGFGLTTLEAAACRIRLIVPMWSALSELFGDVAHAVRCSTTTLTPRVNVIGGVPDEEDFVTEMCDAYTEKPADVPQRVYERACEERFSWDEIGHEWRAMLHDVV